MNLNQITIPSKDLEKSIPFYQQLGLKLIVKSLPHYARFECPDGESTFSIHLSEELPTKEGVVVYFECNNLDEQVKALVAKGIEFEELPSDRTWLWREARLKDLDGNQLILYYGGKNRLNPPWRIKDETTNQLSPEQIVQANLDAYNNRAIDDFMRSFSEDIICYAFANPEPLLTGLDQVRSYYQTLFENSPQLYSTILRRTVFDNKVIDHENISGREGSNEQTEMVLIYEVRNDKIFKITSMKK